MKQILAILVLAIAFASCQDEPKKEETKPKEKTEVKDSLRILYGEYIYVDSAAVLKGRSFVYGVKLDSMAKALGKSVDSLKRDQYDMVPVYVKGVVHQNPEEEGWDEIVEIKEVLKIMEPVSDPAIHIEGGE